jgi:gliding motility-associated-like protein
MIYKQIQLFVLTSWINRRCKNLNSLFLIVTILTSISCYADGSKDLYPAGARGNRAFLYCNVDLTTATIAWPFKTRGTHYVYAKAGEVIATGSSAQGYGQAKIVLTDPNGSVSTTGAGNDLGKINNRSQELAGPKINTSNTPNAYIPFEVTVTVATEGIWQVDFYPPATGLGTGIFKVPNIPATGNWIQDHNGTADPNLNSIAAWDVSVRNGTNWIKGRVYANVLNLHINGVVNGVVNENESYYVTQYILTKDGRAYRVQSNGNNGFGFTFFSNSNGFADNSVPSYQSLNSTSPGDITKFIHDPRKPDQGGNVTHKIFYTKPAIDLPAAARIANLIGTTWLKNNAITPDITQIAITGVEGTAAQLSTKGAYITFNSNSSGTVNIKIPIPSGADRLFNVIASPGTNKVFWDGKDGLGKFVLPGTIITEISMRLLSAEVHFPYIDMEVNPKGIIIELTDNSTDYNLVANSANEGVYSDKVYWDDSAISGAGTLPESSRPVTNVLTGVSSKINGHKWGDYKRQTGTGNSGSGDNSFGNNKSMDTWAYIQGSEEITLLNATMTVADLSIESILPDVQLFSQNHQVIYKVRVKNDGPSPVTGAGFNFIAPPGFSISTVTSSIVSGILKESEKTIADHNYHSKLDLSNQSIIEFSITGTIDVSFISQPVKVEASIIRPPDVTDPDATNMDVSILPVDPLAECIASVGSGICNNIKYSTIVAQDLCLGFPIKPVALQSTTGGNASEITGTIPNGIIVEYDASSMLMKFSGTPATAGTFGFLFGTNENTTGKTTVILQVLAPPAITTQASDLSVCAGSAASFSVQTNLPTDTFKWQYLKSNAWIDFGGTDGDRDFTTSKLTFDHASIDIDQKSIRVLISNEAGCITTSPTYLLSVAPCLPPPALTIPNVFTPNGDGKNDHFVIVGRTGYDVVDLSIFNRWGAEVYHNINYQDEWDGSNLNEGTYFYLLKLKKGGFEETRKSWILLKR